MWPKAQIPKSYRQKNVTTKEWIDWQWQLAHTIKTAQELGNLAKISPQKIQTIQKVLNQQYQNGRDEMRLTPYLLSLINFKNPRDSIALQHLPDAAEMQHDDFEFEKVWERDEDFLDGKNRLLQQKYPDVVVLRISNTCNAFCRFCFEKDRTLRRNIKTKVDFKKFENALKIIRTEKKLRQVLLSGGDPLILPDQILQQYLEKLIKIPQIKTIRINTRALLHNPYRITEEFAGMLAEVQKKSWQINKKGKQIKIGLHFNHPQEISPEALYAMRRLQKNGIQLYNQTVLLKGINDQTAIIQKLFRQLLEEGVELHYLSQGMAVPRTQHLRTAVKIGQKIMQELLATKEFRGQLPHFELCHHTGKQIIPLTMNEIFHEKILKKSQKNHKSIKFLSQISDKWEVFLDSE